MPKVMKSFQWGLYTVFCFSSKLLLKIKVFWIIEKVLKFFNSRIGRARVILSE